MGVPFYVGGAVGVPFNVGGAVGVPLSLVLFHLVLGQDISWDNVLSPAPVAILIYINLPFFFL